MSQLPAMGQNPDLTLTLTPDRAYDLPPSKGLERVYAKCLDDGEAVTNKRIDAALQAA